MSPERAFSFVGETDAHTLSKLASVDFDTLKASLAKIRHSESLMQKKVGLFR